MPVANEKTQPTLAELRSLASPLVAHRSLPFGVEPLDRRLAGKGLCAGALHEIVARSCSLVDDAAATLFTAGIAAREANATGAPVLWVSCRTDRQHVALASGLSAFAVG